MLYTIFHEKKGFMKLMKLFMKHVEYREVFERNMSRYHERISGFHMKLHNNLKFHPARAHSTRATTSQSSRGIVKKIREMDNSNKKPYFLHKFRFIFIIIWF
jgi:hypothetical protein